MAARQAHRTDVRVEGLEARNLLSVTTQLVQYPVFNVPNAGTLVISADRSNNQLAVVESPVDADTSLLTVIGYGNTRVYGQSTFTVERPAVPVPANYATPLAYQAALNNYLALEANDVDRIVFLGNTGNDKFQNATSVPSIIDGGSGNNVLIGGSATDYILAGPGNDILVGNAGDDFLYGDARLVSYRPANATPVIQVLTDRGGNDRMYGGLGNDTAYGGRGNDVFVGGSGNDVFVDFGLGKDRFDQNGSDWWWNFWGSDCGPGRESSQPRGRQPPPWLPGPPWPSRPTLWPSSESQSEGARHPRVW